METCVLFRSLPAILTLGLLFMGVAADRGSAMAGNPMMGGPCAYKSYPGRARIISIRPIVSPGAAGAVFEVQYVFQPDGLIAEPFAQTAGRTFLLTLINGSHPTQKFLEKYRIEEGRVVDCVLKVITKGTCTPTLFEFPGVDLVDYGTR